MYMYSLSIQLFIHIYSVIFSAINRNSARLHHIVCLFFFSILERTFSLLSCQCVRYIPINNNENKKRERSSLFLSCRFCSSHLLHNDEQNIIKTNEYVWYNMVYVSVRIRTHNEHSLIIITCKKIYECMLHTLTIEYQSTCRHTLRQRFSKNEILSGLSEFLFDFHIFRIKNPNELSEHLKRSGK